MIIGIGSDLVDIRRIEHALDRHGDRFVQRVFSAGEQATANSRRERAAAYAKRFAAKEATAKALGTGLNKGIYWRDMSVETAPGGRPSMVLTGGAKDRLAALTPPGRNMDIHLTITDDFPLAQAFVILYASPVEEKL